MCGGSSRVVVEVVRRWYGSRPLKCWCETLPTSASPADSTSMYTGFHHVGYVRASEIAANTDSRGAATSHSSTKRYSREATARTTRDSACWTRGDGRAAPPSDA